jgi:O-antigen ligase
MPRVAPGARRALLVYLAGAALASLLALVSVIDPVLGIAGALTIALAVGFTRSATFGICAFAFFTYFEVVTSHTGTALSPIKVCGAALIVTALLDLVLRSRHGVRRASPAWSRHPIVVAAMVGFVAVGVASASWAVNVDQVHTLTTRLVTDVLVFIAIGVLLVRREQLMALSATLLAAGVLSTAVGAVLGNEAFGRTLGGFLDPNEYAAAMVVSIGAAFGVLGAARSPWTRRACVAGMAVCGWGILASQSRGALFALAAAAAYIVLSSRGRERIRLMGATLVILAAGVSVLMLTPTGQQSLERITNGDSSGRSDLWRIAVLQFQDQPVHGVGLGNYPVVASRYVTADTEHTELVNTVAPRTTHNTYLEIAAELGLLGLVTFGMFAGGCVLLGMRGVRAARRLGDAGAIRLGRGLVAATIGLLGSSFFLSGQYAELLWLLLASCVAFHAYVAHQLRLLAAIETAHEIVANLPVDEIDADLSEVLAVAALDELDVAPETLVMRR